MPKEKITVPKVLYYVTIHFPDGTRRTPNFFLWENIDDAFKGANDLVLEGGMKYRSLSARKIVFKKTVPITPDFFHEVPEGEAVTWTPEFNQSMIDLGETKIPKALVVVLSHKGGAKQPDLFLDEWFHTDKVNQAMALMKKSNLPLFIGTKVAHVYKPTEEVHWTGWN